MFLVLSGARAYRTRTHPLGHQLSTLTHSIWQKVRSRVTKGR